MNLADYEKLVASAEAEPASEGLFVNAGILRAQMERALWTPRAKAKAAELISRLRAVEDRSAKAAGVA